MVSQMPHFVGMIVLLTLCILPKEKSQLQILLCFTGEIFNQVIGLVAVHVDDFIWCGNIEFENTVINDLRRTFLVGKEETKCFQYLGVQLKQSLMGISMDQYHYINSLKEIDLSNIEDQSSSSELDDNLKDNLRSKVGQ